MSFFFQFLELIYFSFLSLNLRLVLLSKNLGSLLSSDFNFLNNLSLSLLVLFLCWLFQDLVFLRSLGNNSILSDILLLNIELIISILSFPLLVISFSSLFLSLISPLIMLVIMSFTFLSLDFGFCVFTFLDILWPSALLLGLNRLFNNCRIHINYVY